MKHEELWPIVAARLRTFVGRTWNIQAVAAATNSTEQTVGGWLVDAKPPVGERLVRLWHFTRTVGIKSPELDELPEIIQYFGRLLTASVVTLDEVSDELCVRNGQTALRILRGEQSPMHFLRPAVHLHARYDSELRRAEAAYPIFVAEKPSAGEPSWTDQTKLAANLLSGTGHTDLTLATLLSAALPLAKYMNSDGVTPRKRSEFRELIGPDTLFALSNVVSSLCSERSRGTER